MESFAIFGVLAILAIIVLRNGAANWMYVQGATCTPYNQSSSGSGDGTIHLTLPANACASGSGGLGGGLTVTSLTAHGGGKGFIFTVTFDGGAPIVTGCLDGASQVIPIPANTVDIQVDVVSGCAGGAGGSYTISAIG